MASRMMRDTIAASLERCRRAPRRDALVMGSCFDVTQAGMEVAGPRAVIPLHVRFLYSDGTMTDLATGHPTAARPAHGDEFHGIDWGGPDCQPPESQDEQRQAGHSEPGSHQRGLAVRRVVETAEHEGRQTCHSQLIPHRHRQQRDTTFRRLIKNLGTHDGDNLFCIVRVQAAADKLEGALYGQIGLRPVPRPPTTRSPRHHRAGPRRRRRARPPAAPTARAPAS